MNRHPSSLRSAATAVVAADMSYRPNFRGSRSRGWRGYSDKPSDSCPESISGDSHFNAVRDANRSFRPNYTAVPPPQQFRGSRPGPPYAQQFPGPGPYRQPRPNGPAFGSNQEFRPQQMHQQFRPQQMQQQLRPRASKPPDYREWEYAAEMPPSQCERFTVLTYNILADYLAIDHCQKLYFHIPHYILDWNWRKRSIMFELGLWSADIMCFQEVDRYHDIEAELKQRGYTGIWKMRTGDPVDGCAIFWRVSRFKLLHEESIEYCKLGLRDNVAQICVFEFLNKQNNISGVPPLSTSSGNPIRVVICNIHVLFNPKRGDIKLGQIRVLLDKAHAVSKLWDDAPVVICGDFNCTPESPLYNFITEQKLDLSDLPRDKVSGQASAEIRPTRPAVPDFRTPSTDDRINKGSRNDSQDEDGSPISSAKGASDEIVSLEPSNETIRIESTDARECAESKLEEITEVSDAPQPVEPAGSLSHNLLDDSSSENQAVISAESDNHPASSALGYPSLESTDADFELNEKIESLSLTESVGEAADEHQEDCDSFISELHCSGQSPFPFDTNSSFQNMHSREIRKDALSVEHEAGSDDGKSPYSPSAWTPMEIQTATGSADSKVMEHPLKLKSSYAEVQNSSGLRDSSGEPLVTSYHRRFLGTVDYIWHSKGLQTAKVLAPIPKDVMLQTRGFPTKKWGSDHIALVSEFAFAKDTST